MRTRAGATTEALELSSLAMESKRYWGYDDAFMELCRPELTVGVDDVERGLVVVAEDESGHVVGFYMLSDAPRPELSMLFVSPDAIGRGVGKELIRDALSVARSRDWANLVIESDPFAASFYERMGAVLIGSVRSPSTGRTLSLYELSTAEQ
ncbi:MAG: GNAT family N-acetyltransferase [Acidimicrobiales bacterium]